MNKLSLSPLFRHTVGFDHLDRLFDSMGHLEDASAYPPYNIEKIGDDNYRVTLAVAGFGEEDITITAQGNELVIEGCIEEQEEQEERTYLYKGIAGRAFQRKFELADHVNVIDANLENGLLHVSLQREVPEEAKPRTIAISNGSKAKKLNK